MELVLVRHGEPEWVVQGRNRNDPRLTTRGRAQALQLAGRLADPTQEPVNGRIDHLVVSPARRAAETAHPIAEALGHAAVTHDWLLELQMPDSWDDQPIEVAQEAFAQQRGRPRHEWWDGLKGAERVSDFHDRVSGGLDQVLAGWGVRATDDPSLWEIDHRAPQRVVVVAHGGTNSTLVAHLIGVPKEPWDWERFHMGHASVAVLRTQPIAGAAIWSLCALGDAAHLDIGDRTA